MPPKILLISASDFKNDSRLQRIHRHAETVFGDLRTVAYGKYDSDQNKILSPIPVRSLFQRLFDVSKMLISRVLPEAYFLKLLSNRHIVKDLQKSSFDASETLPFDFVIVKHWTSLPIALLLHGKPNIWLDINEVFEAEHDNSKLWQLIYKPVIIRLLKLAKERIVLRSATSLDQIKYMGDSTILHLPNTKKPIEFIQRKTKQNKKIKLLYHGLITTNRSLETAIKALHHCGRSDLELTIRGNGKPKYIESLKNLVIEMEISSQVHFEPSIENKKLISAASHYDIGLCLFDNQSLQLLLAEPNKIYEYMAAGLAVIASETPTMTRMVTAQSIGKLTKISQDQTHSLTHIFKHLERGQISAWQDNSKRQAFQTWHQNYDWPKLDLSLKQIQQEISQHPNKN